MGIEISKNVYLEGLNCVAHMEVLHDTVKGWHVKIMGMQS
jgi:hypothetical protein